ncbi:MAG: 1-acyl-sn-glycerol-3-phosphate acyltransferase [Actinomycetota bacterium]
MAGGAARDDLRATVLALVGEVLGRGGPPPGPADGLADLGFDSIAYAELAAALHERSGVDLVDAGLGPLRTVEDLCDAVERAGRRPGAAGEVVPVRLGSGQGLAKSALAGLFGWWFDVSVAGAEHMPGSGPVVLCMNHESMLDVPAAAVASPRAITFMAKRELFRTRFATQVMGRLGAFSVDRELFDLRAIRIGLDVVRRGQVLGMYPEGTRTPRVLQPFLPGAPWIALSTGAPLLPCGIAGTEVALPRGSRIPKRVPIQVTFAPLIEVEQIDDLLKRRTEAERLAGELRDAVAPLLSYP